MVNSEKNIYLQETEVKPNKYATYVLIFTLIGILFCWFFNEIGVFRVGKWEMRIGSLVPLVVISIPLFMMSASEKTTHDPRMKYVIIAAGAVFTLTVNTLLTFHTTIMLLFPIFVAMLYRSKKLGIVAVISALVCTIVSPILGYVLGVWDIELFKELILIGTNGETVIVGASPAITTHSICKILLYLVMPRLIMVGSCSLLMFYVIRVGVDHVNNQILLNNVSHRDVLTGLYNQNYYKEILCSDKFQGQVGVVFFDVNGLKNINDAYGHEMGDLLLRRSAQSLVNICDEDVTSAFRIGGDEFLLLIEGADEAVVSKKLDDWAASLEAVNRENLEQYDGLVCSMAAGYIVGDFQELELLVRQADILMYRNKAKMKATQGGKTNK